MMYKTYQEARIDCPNACVCKDKISGMFFVMPSKEGSVLSDTSEFAEAKDYCMNVTKFKSKGLEFAIGDRVLGINDIVFKINTYDIKEWNDNNPHPNDDNLFILQAKALEMPNETPEESEALDAIAQVDSEEWKNGLPPIGVECEILFKEYPHKGFGLFNVLAYHGGAIWVQYVGPLANNGKCYTAECSTLEFRKPETPQQREERERLEAVRKMWVDCGYMPSRFDIPGLEIEKTKKDLFAIYDAGYRKESK